MPSATRKMTVKFGKPIYHAYRLTMTFRPDCDGWDLKIETDDSSKFVPETMEGCLQFEAKNMSGAGLDSFAEFAQLAIGGEILEAIKDLQEECRLEIAGKGAHGDEGLARLIFDQDAEFLDTAWGKQEEFPDRFRKLREDQE